MCFLLTLMEAQAKTRQSNKVTLDTTKCHWSFLTLTFFFKASEHLRSWRGNIYSTSMNFLETL